MAGTLIVSNLKTDTDNSFIVRSNTGTTLFVANTTGIDVANSFASSSITSDKILTVANTKISGNIISSQITSVANTQISGNIISSQIASVNGSVITANTIANSAIQTGAVENYMSAAGLGFGMRNRIINGAMVIDQRNAGASISADDSKFAVDRFLFNMQTNSKGTGQQSTDAPPGFKYSLLYTNGSAYTVPSGDTFGILQKIEGNNLFDLAWGTASAQSVTLSFWVKSSLTGTFGGALKGSTVTAYTYAFTYTINSANTWEQKSITIAGPTVGTWDATTGTGITLSIGLGNGSTVSITPNSWTASNSFSATGAISVLGTASATFYITGVQLEKGSTATSFDYRSYGAELQLCQRYCVMINSANASSGYLRYGMGQTVNTTGTNVMVSLPVSMRITPSLTNSTVSGFASYASNVLNTVTSMNLADSGPFSFAHLGVNVGSGLTAGQASVLLSNNNQTSYLLFTAEL